MNDDGVTGKVEKLDLLKRVEEDATASGRGHKEVMVDDVGSTGGAGDSS